MTCVGADSVQIATVRPGNGLRAIVLGSRQHHLGETNDEVERRTKLVANRRDELGLGALRFVRRAPCRDQGGVVSLQPIVGLVEVLDDGCKLGSSFLSIP